MKIIVSIIMFIVVAATFIGAGYLAGQLNHPDCVPRNCPLVKPDKLKPSEYPLNIEPEIKYLPCQLPHELTQCEVDLDFCVGELEILNNDITDFNKTMDNKLRSCLYTACQKDNKCCELIN